MILSRRANDDDHRDGFTKWPFMTTHSWGEYPQGTWKLEVRLSVLYFSVTPAKVNYSSIMAGERN